MISKPLKQIGRHHFGALVEGLRPADLLQTCVGRELRRLWIERGVLVVRGLEELTPEALVAVSAHFGPVSDLEEGRSHAALQGVDGKALPVMRIGNVRASNGSSVSQPSGASYDLLAGGLSCQYRPAEKIPVWHTDATFREKPPAGSVLFCRQAPKEGGATCVADMRAAWASLASEEQCDLERLDCVCSLSHHDAVVYARDPTAPAPTPALRNAHPAQRVPMVLRHPITGQKALYGWNSGTCCIMPRDAKLDSAQLTELETSAIKHSSVATWLALLQRVTAPAFTTIWRWRIGDLLVWDNRSTMHCATGFDRARYVREMWRTTILADGDAASGAPKL